MRFVWAVVAFVLATVLIGAGIAQRTIFMGPSEQRMEVTVDQPTPYVLVDADVLRAHTGLQTLMVRGEGDIVVAYGRTDDMTAWLSDTSYDLVTLDRTGDPETSRVEAAQPPAEGGETSGRSPVGSDLWLDEFADQDALVAEMQLTAGNSVLIARDGTQPAPDDILVSWALDTRTPWAGPLMAAGALLLAAGLVLYVLAIRYQRRGRGPRRKGPGPLPETQPISLPERARIEAGAEPGPENDSEPTDSPATPDRPGDAGAQQRTASHPRRLALALPALALTAVIATGCSADSWPQFGAATPTPTPTPSVVAPENQKPPVVTEKQGARIVADIAGTLEKADADLDADLASTRLSGDALAGRKTEYILRDKIAERDTVLALPLGKVRILLPEATGGWPRTVLALTASEDDDTKPPVVLTMTQTDPWSNYRVSSIAEMPASSTFPDVAPAWLGTTRVPEESAFLSLAPAELADAFSDFVDAGDKSEFSGRFDEVSQKLAEAIRDSRAAVVKKAADAGASKTSKATFAMTPADDEPLSMATLDSGAVVTVNVIDTQTVKPTNSDAVIRFGGDEQAKALTGVKESAKGYVTAYGMQLFFAVPAQGSNEQIRLLAYHQDLLSVKVIK
ncbi:glycosyl transferase [Microbacterium sp. NPDC058342]|uniref:glycosyl transferase n=1 Tax=Microbacterium sp. NPDC058342 TaxID=3346454 RepID=UPI00365C07F8